MVEALLEKTMRKYAQRFSFIATATYRNSFLGLFHFFGFSFLSWFLASLLALFLSLPRSRPIHLVVGRAHTAFYIALPTPTSAVWMLGSASLKSLAIRKRWGLRQSRQQPSGSDRRRIPLTGGNNFYETGFNSVWTWIGSKLPFRDRCDCAIFRGHLSP